MRTLSIHAIGLFIAAAMLSGCGNIDVVKRRHMPGYHIDFSKAEKHERAGKETVATASAMEQAGAVQAIEPATEAVPIVVQASIAPAANEPAVSPATSAGKADASAAAQVLSRMAAPQGWAAVRKEIAETRTALAAPASDTHWMAWVSFGTGIASAVFGLVGLIIAFFGFNMWAAAITFGVAAIVFAIIHAKKGYGGESFRKIGLLTGIIGASLGLLGLIIWSLWVARVFGRGRG